MYFNQRFDLSALEMHRLGVFNPLMEHDSQLFVDPKLVEQAGPEFVGAKDDLSAYFQDTVDLLRLSQRKNDKCWEGACKHMIFEEKASAGIGFSKSGKRGNAIGPILARRIVAQAAEILPLVDYKPNIFELIGVFTEGLGCDRISDMFVSILADRFYAYTQRMAENLGIHQLALVQGRNAPFLVPCFSAGEGPIILFPKVVLRPLPLAADIGEALERADLNEQTRSEANKMWSEAAKVKRELGKRQIQQFIAQKPKAIYQQILSGYEKAESTPYDFDKDPLNISDVRALAKEIVGTPGEVNREGSPTERVESVLASLLRDLRKLIQENRLSDLLFNDNGTPRKEVVAQRLIHAIADIYGRVYNVDLNREPNSGNGPVDFKFSVGREARVLIEVKLSTHKRIQDGYYYQLPAYARSEDVKRLILLVIQVDDSTDQLEALQLAAIEEDCHKIQIELIDARRRPSASKLKS